MSDAIVKLSTSAHWYGFDKKPCHTVIGKNGMERSTTLRDARQMNLLPSVTTIIKLLAAPQLTRWMVENAIVAAVTTERRPDEDETAFAKRIATEAGEVAGNAADFGTRFHKLMEDLLSGYEDVFVADDLVAFVPLAREWIAENVAEVISTEQVVIGDGYAGTADLFCVTPDGEKVLFDFKTKAMNKDAKGSYRKPQAYDNWGYQLAAYGEVLGADRVCNVVVNSREPLPFTNVWHKPEKREEAWKVFQGVRDLWQLINRYSPVNPN